MTQVKEFLSKEHQELIITAIKEAEKNTSGEIRVHVESHAKKPTFERAVEVFNMLNMYKTDARNGVLFYMALADKTFAIIGDKGIDAVVPKGFWDSVKDIVIAQFKKNAFAEGLELGIVAAGKKLKQYFPIQIDDKNELPDTISIGD